MKFEIPETLIVISSSFSMSFMNNKIAEIKKPLMQRYLLTTVQGVVVTRVVPNSVGGKIGIQAGDIIRQVNQARIKNKQNFNAAMIDAAGRSSILLLVQRGQNGYYVTLEP